MSQKEPKVEDDGRVEAICQVCDELDRCHAVYPDTRKFPGQLQNLSLPQMFKEGGVLVGGGKPGNRIVDLPGTHRRATLHLED